MHIMFSIDTSFLIDVTPHFYRVISCDGPTNTRRYTVAVYFRDKRLDTGMGHSIHQAEMEAAEKALTSNKGTSIYDIPLGFLYIVIADSLIGYTHIANNNIAITFPGKHGVGQ